MAGVMQHRSKSCSTAVIGQPCRLARNAGMFRIRSQALHTSSIMVRCTPPGSMPGFMYMSAQACAMVRHAQAPAKRQPAVSTANQHACSRALQQPQQEALRSAPTWPEVLRRLQDRSHRSLKKPREALQDGPCRGAAEDAGQALADNSELRQAQRGHLSPPPSQCRNNTGHTAGA